MRQIPGKFAIVSYLSPIDGEQAIGLNLQRLLLVSAILAGELDAALAFFRLNPVWRAALAADSLDAGRALLHDDGLLFHRFADQALGLLTQGLFRQSSSPPLKAREPYRTCVRISIGNAGSDLDNHITVFDMHRKGLGDIRAFLQFIAAFHRNRI